MTQDPMAAPAAPSTDPVDAEVVDRSAFRSDNVIGDAGRQPDVVPVAGPLTVGVPDSILDFLTDGDLELRGCATRGWSHRHAGTPRQDFFAIQVSDDLLVVAVADGVSAGASSHVAAETAARSACKLVADRWRDGEPLDWDLISRRVSMRILDEAEYRQLVSAPAPDATIDDRLRACVASMATTLVVCAMRRRATHDGYETWLAVLAGDSGVYKITDSRLEPLSGGKDPGSVISSTAVRPLPGAVTPTELTVHLQPGEALLLCTDGIGDPVGDGSGEVGTELAARWSAPPTIDGFLRDVNFYRKTYDDDRTAVGIWIRPGAVLPPEPEPEAEPAAEPDPAPEVATAADTRVSTVDLLASAVQSDLNTVVDPTPDELAPPGWVNEDAQESTTSAGVEPDEQ